MNMKKWFAILAVCAAGAWGLRGAEMINISDFVPTDGKTDVADAIQKVICENPNRTIYFPDGTYLISKPICTPAHPAKSVHLKLDRYAVIQAAPGWKHTEAMIRLGGIDPANNIYRNGSMYGIEGGIINGAGVATGISIDSGRESVIRECSIKEVRIGIHIKKGANSGSSDADIVLVNITGNNAPDSVGVLVEGYDNTFLKMRIAAFNTGVRISAGGNAFRDIHPLQSSRGGMTAEQYQTTVGFDIRSDNNTLDYCYSDNFAVGFRFSKGRNSTLINCFCFWYAATGKKHTAIKAEGPLESVLTNFRADFNVKGVENVLLGAEPGGRGVLRDPIVRGPVSTLGPLKAYSK